MPQQSQHASPVDPEFVATLRTNISGIFFASANRFTPEQIEREFRNSVSDPTLVADETFMHNLMFLVRKKEVRALHDDVERVLTKGGLTPRAEVSTMKTLYALGSTKDRVVVDDQLTAKLESQLKSRDALSPSPYLESADRIGGAKTLNMLKAFQEEAARQQQQAEQKSPNDHVGIAQLDQMRSSAENKVFYLSLKLSVLAKDETDRATEMFKYYLRRTGFLGFWGYKELVGHPSPAAVNAIRGFNSHRLDELLPGGGISAEDRSRLLLEYQLRGVCLLQVMKAELTPEEEKLLGDHAAMLNERKEFFRPGHDWEDVLDRS